MWQRYDTIDKVSRFLILCDIFTDRHSEFFVIIVFSIIIFIPYTAHSHPHRTLLTAPKNCDEMLPSGMHLTTLLLNPFTCKMGFCPTNSRHSTSPFTLSSFIHGLLCSGTKKIKANHYSINCIKEPRLASHQHFISTSPNPHCRSVHTRFRGTGFILWLFNPTFFFFRPAFYPRPRFPSLASFDWLKSPRLLSTSIAIAIVSMGVFPKRTNSLSTKYRVWPRDTSEGYSVFIRNVFSPLLSQIFYLVYSRCLVTIFVFAFLEPS